MGSKGGLIEYFVPNDLWELLINHSIPRNETDGQFSKILLNYITGKIEVWND
jgi:hypothetical protein